MRRKLQEKYIQIGFYKNVSFLMHFFLKYKREPNAETVQYTNRLYGDFFAVAEAMQFKSYINVLNIWVGFFFNKV